MSPPWLHQLHLPQFTSKDFVLNLASFFSLYLCNSAPIPSLSSLTPKAHNGLPAALRAKREEEQTFATVVSNGSAGMPSYRVAPALLYSNSNNTIIIEYNNRYLIF
jgi:hypothetical protein